MVLVGVTGQTGAGKTLVGSYLREKGLHVIDADLVAREVAGKDSDCLMELVLAFGVGILSSDGGLNRRKLADIAFSDVSKRKVLERITFPFITREILARVERLREDGAKIVFLDAPTLFESGSDSRCDRIVSVIAPAEVRIERIIRRDGISEQQALIRMGAQRNDEFYTSRSDHVIVNDGDIAALYRRVDELLLELEDVYEG